MRKKSADRLKNYGLKIAVILIWLLAWELLSLRINEEIFLPAPGAVCKALLSLSGTLEFWRTILYSSLRIISGFILAITVGIGLAVCSHNSRVKRELISPVMRIIKAVPVASFIILALLWVNKKNLSVLISFLMVLPLIYSSVVQGLKAADTKLLEMAKVFRLSVWKKTIAIYVPAVLPYFISGVSVGIGFCWKSGIAAEVIGIPTGSIGERLYEAKLYLMTKELFAWTVVILAISLLFEKLFLQLLRLVDRRSAKGGAPWTFN